MNESTTRIDLDETQNDSGLLQELLTSWNMGDYFAKLKSKA